MQRPKKIAVLTKANFNFQARDYRIDYFVWGKLTEQDSLSDYDILIVDLASLRNRNIVRWHIVEKILTPVVTRDILTGGGQIIIMGNPNFFHQSVINKKRVPFLAWTGLACEWVDQSGDTIIPAAANVPTGVQRYVNHVGRWSGALRSCEVYPGFIKMLTRVVAETEPNLQYKLECRHFYRNRYNCALAFAVAFSQVQIAEQTSKLAQRLGPILFLPETTLGAEEALEIVLRDICEVSTASREPGWARRIMLPNHKEIDDEIIERMAEIERAYERLNQLENLRSSAREALRLLYDSGSTLEEIVRVVMGELGATVTPPEEVGAHSGKIAVDIGGKTYEGLLSVLAISIPEFAERELDNLGRKLSFAVETDRKEYKGIFIGNAGVDRDPSERGDPFSFHFNENAKLRHMSLLTTQNLYDIYIMHLTDTLNREKFWSELFSTDGQLMMNRLQTSVPPAKAPAKTSAGH